MYACGTELAGIKNRLFMQTMILVQCFFHHSTWNSPQTSTSGQQGCILLLSCSQVESSN